MKKQPPYHFIRILCILYTFLFSATIYPQVGIGTTTPNADALLDVDATTTNGGILLPRLALTSTSSPSPLSTDVEGMIVYNTATTGDVTSGFYYNDGTDWIRIGSEGSSSDDWKTTGNAGTTAGTNYVGTSDSQNLIFKTNDSENMRILTDGRVAINDTSPFVGDRFTVTGASDDYAINGYASGSAGVAIYGESSSFDAIVGNGSRFGVLGLGNYGVYGSGTSSGVYGSVDNATGFGMLANNDNATGVGLLVSGSNAPLNYLSNTGATINGNMAVAGFSTSSTGTGISGIGNAGTTSRTLTAGSGVAGNGDTGVYGLSNATSNGTGIIGIGDETVSITTNSSGSGIAGSGSSLGIFGYAGNGDVSVGNQGNAGGEFVLDADNDPTTNSGDNGNRARARLAGFDKVTPDGSANSKNSYFGGYFSGGSESSNTPSYAYVGMRYNTNGDGDGGGTDYKVIGTGTVSTLINDTNGTPRVMFAPEAPEIVFQDFGVGTLVNGIARIDLDSILKGSLFIDNTHPLKVYVTLEGECNGIYVTNKTADGFTVKELQGGTSNVSFSWQIVANRADTKNNNGTIISKHVGVRLPVGPGPLTSKLKKLETTNLTTKLVKDNSIDISINKVLGSKSEAVVSKPKK